MAKNPMASTIILMFCMSLTYQKTLPAERATPIDFATIFSAPNLAICNPQQKPQDVQQYIGKPDFNIDVFFCDEKPTDFALATISFLVNPEKIWIKTMALNPNLTPSQIGGAIRKLQKCFKLRTPRANISCNLHVDENLAKNRELQASLATLGWHQLKEFISLSKQLPLLIPEDLRKTKLSGFEIVSADESHYDDILTLYSHPDIAPWLNCTPEDSQAYLQRPQYTKIIAMKNKQIIGALVASVLPSNRGYINMLAVQPECQKRGVGSALLQRIESILHAKDHTINAIDINAIAHNVSALTCYERNGYGIVTRRMNMSKDHTPGISPQLPALQEIGLMSPTQPLAPAALPPSQIILPATAANAAAAAV